MEGNNRLNNSQNTEANKNIAENSSKKKNTKILITLVLIVGVAVGIVLGLLASGKNFTQIINKSDKTINENENKNNQLEQKTSKKIDETKPWVYEAEYHNNRSNKTITGYFEGDEWNSKDLLKYPYININSKYAKTINEELYNYFENNYNAFGPVAGSNYSIIIQVSYEYQVTDNILSIILKSGEGRTNSGLYTIYNTYNINLNTLEEASLEDLYKECGFSSENQLNDNINNALKNYSGMVENPVWDGKSFFIGKDKIFNIIIGLDEFSYIEVKNDTN